MYKRERVIGYEEYQVDTNGVVYSKRGKPLKPSINHNGYAIINLYVNKRRIGFAVHTIVAKQFIENDNPQRCQVNHLDGNKLNNAVDNLEWVTPKENVIHAKRTLNFRNDSWHNSNAKAIIAMNKDSGDVMMSFDSIADAARYLDPDPAKYRIKQKSICRALKKATPIYMGYIWRLA